MEVTEVLRKHYQRPYFLPPDAEAKRLDWIFMGSKGYGAPMHVSQKVSTREGKFLVKLNEKLGLFRRWIMLSIHRGRRSCRGGKSGSCSLHLSASTLALFWKSLSNLVKSVRNLKKKFT